jgi:hypothetical protein
MGELGNIFEESDDPSSPRGPDVRVAVQVPRRALGDPDGFWAPVPAVVEQEGRAVVRAAAPGEQERGVQLFLPPALQPGSVLRLRRQGGVSPEADGAPGDLYVQIELVESAGEFRWLVVGIAVVLAAAAIALLAT